MAWKFDNPRFGFGSDGGNPQIAAGKRLSIFRRKPVAAAKLFRCFRYAVKFVSSRTLPDNNGLR